MKYLLKKFLKRPKKHETVFYDERWIEDEVDWAIRSEIGIVLDKNFKLFNPHLENILNRLNKHYLLSNNCAIRTADEITIQDLYNHAHDVYKSGKLQAQLRKQPPFPPISSGSIFVQKPISTNIFCASGIVPINYNQPYQPLHKMNIKYTNSPNDAKQRFLDFLQKGGESDEDS